MYTAYTTYKRSGMTNFKSKAPKASQSGCIVIIGFFLIILLMVLNAIFEIFG